MTSFSGSVEREAIAAELIFLTIAEPLKWTENLKLLHLLLSSSSPGAELEKTIPPSAASSNRRISDSRD